MVLLTIVALNFYFYEGLKARFITAEDSTTNRSLRTLMCGAGTSRCPRSLTTTSHFSGLPRSRRLSRPNPHVPIRCPPSENASRRDERVLPRVLGRVGRDGEDHPRRGVVGRDVVSNLSRMMLRGKLMCRACAAAVCGRIC